MLSCLLCVWKVAIDLLLLSISCLVHCRLSQMSAFFNQGMMLQQPSTVAQGPEGAKQFIRLWVHEVLRVFYDRLVDDADRNWLLQFIGKLIKKQFHQDFEKLFPHLLSDSLGTIGQIEMRRYISNSKLWNLFSNVTNTCRSGWLIWKSCLFNLYSFLIQARVFS